MHVEVESFISLKYYTLHWQNRPASLLYWTYESINVVVLV